jgi:hypothetical protein
MGLSCIDDIKFVNQPWYIDIWSHLISNCSFELHEQISIECDAKMIQLNSIELYVCNFMESLSYCYDVEE